MNVGVHVKSVSLLVASYDPLTVTLTLSPMTKGATSRGFSDPILTLGTTWGVNFEEYKKQIFYGMRNDSHTLVNMYILLAKIDLLTTISVIKRESSFFKLCYH